MKAVAHLCACGCKRMAPYAGGYNSRDCLAPVAVSRFEEVRTIIRRGKRTFIEVGEALMEMRDGKLYKDGGFTNFEEFCEAEGLSRSYAYRIMGAAKQAVLSTNQIQVGDIPRTERAARRLREPAEAVTIEAPCAHPRKRCADCGADV